LVKVSPPCTTFSSGTGVATNLFTLGFTFGI